MRVPDSTASLIFRAWREDDLPLARALWGDPRVSPFDDAAIAERLEFELHNQREHGFAYWPIFTLGGEHVGCCGLKPKPREPSLGIHELGFYLRPAFWGRGLAVEASRSAIAHAFGALGAAVLFAGHHPENHGSRRTLEKLGFRYTHDEHYPPTGLMHPGYELVRTSEHQTSGQTEGRSDSSSLRP
ncbi:MAG TPA: GNAT family N-acetyltransferase [Kofleriaceae bacterium]